MKDFGLLLLLSMCLVQPSLADCDDLENPVPSDDCDGDGYTVGEGDCDDTDGDVFPDADEICGDDVDNNCDDEVDEGCGSPIEEGALMGGSSCGQSGGGLAWFFPLFLFGRRHR